MIGSWLTSLQPTVPLRVMVKSGASVGSELARIE